MDDPSRFTISAARAARPDSVGPLTVRVENGVITALDEHESPGADVVVDPADVLLPGGVDTHVHLNEPGRTDWEGFATGTAAAAEGGVTTVLDMPLNSIPSTTTPEALATKRAAAAGKLSVDLGYWGGAVPQNLGHLKELWDEGVFGMKCFTLPSGVDEFEPLDADQLRTAMTEIASFGGLLIVHAEDGHIIEEAPARHSKAYSDFLLSRPDEAELTAIKLVIDTMRETGCRVHLLHLSSARGLELVAAARAEGLPLTVETCPHYLCLSAEQIPDGAPEFKCCPPIRDAGNQEEMWQGLTDGLIDIVVTDHSPSTRARKFAGDGDLQLAWGGIAGVQVGYTAMLDSASKRGIDLSRVAQWMSQRPAEIMSVPGKGGLMIGHDADLAVWSPRTPMTVDAKALLHRNPISAWHGYRSIGSVTDVWLRGTHLEGDEVMGRELFRA
ncbi:allantoinase AllB [Propionibacterium sp.]|uniref:allantoinase AllB n=1 Tax=Propionibacterium sp. TaxID=1977903 RepID=UPI0039E93B14